MEKGTKRSQENQPQLDPRVLNREEKEMSGPEAPKFTYLEKKGFW